jgi:hypothetical protein
MQMSFPFPSNDSQRAAESRGMGMIPSGFLESGV